MELKKSYEIYDFVTKKQPLNYFHIKKLLNPEENFWIIFSTGTKYLPKNYIRIFLVLYYSIRTTLVIEATELKPINLNSF